MGEAGGRTYLSIFTPDDFAAAGDEAQLADVHLYDGSFRDDA
jgi:hypothetical protein